MSSLNRAEIIGHVGRDPDIRYTQSGDPVATINVATNEKWTDKNTGEKQERTEWHRCTVFGKLAEVVEKYVKKGSQVYFAGKLQTRKWQDNNGIDRYTTEIRVFDIVLLGGRERSGPPHPADDEPKQEARTESAQKNDNAPIQGNMESEYFDDDIPF